MPLVLWIFSGPELFGQVSKEIEVSLELLDNFVQLLRVRRGGILDGVWIFCELLENLLNVVHSSKGCLAEGQKIFVQEDPLSLDF